MDGINVYNTWLDVFVMLLTMVLFFLSSIYELAGIAFIFSLIIFIFFCV